MRLETDGVEPLEDELVEKFNPIAVNTNGSNLFIYVERRVGAVIARKKKEYYKLPHNIVPERIEAGDAIGGICTLCHEIMFWDSMNEEYYCPICERW